jgi:hypothetical protein
MHVRLTIDSKLHVFAFDEAHSLRASRWTETLGGSADHAMLLHGSGFNTAEDPWISRCRSSITLWV